MPTTPNDTDDNMERAKKKTHGNNTHRENTTKERWGEEMRDKYLTTWTIPDGGKRRQLDYIAIDAKYRNTDRTAHSNVYWHANMRQNQHRRVQKMTLYYNAAKKYKTPTLQDTGGDLNDIRELRLRPEKLAIWYQEPENEETKARGEKEIHQQEKINNETQEWINYKNKL